MDLLSSSGSLQRSGTPQYYCGQAVAALMRFAQLFVGPGMHGVREVMCVPEVTGKITKCSLHRVCYITPACFL